MTLKRNYNPVSNTRGNKYKLLNRTFHYDIRKYCFWARIVNTWNSLPNSVVDLFKARLDKLWLHQDVKMVAPWCYIWFNGRPDRNHIQGPDHRNTSLPQLSPTDMSQCAAPSIVWHPVPVAVATFHQDCLCRVRLLSFGTCYLELNFLGQFSIVRHWRFSNLGLKLIYFTWRTLTNMTLLALPPPLKLRHYGGIELCVLLLLGLLLLYWVYPRLRSTWYTVHKHGSWTELICWYDNHSWLCC